MIKIKNSRIAAWVVSGVIVAGGVLVTGPGLAVPAMADTCAPVPGACQAFGPGLPPPSFLDALHLPLAGLLGPLLPALPGASGFGQSAGGATCHIICLGLGHHGNPGHHTTPPGTTPPGTTPSGPPTVSGFGQVAAAPVKVKAPINQLVGTVGAPLINISIPCAAPWNQGGVAGARYNACSTGPAHQENGPAGWHPMSGADRHATVSGFGQVAAAPVKVKAPINQLVGTVGAPLINISIPCPAPWQQGGLLGSRYNACNTAPAHQENG